MKKIGTHNSGTGERGDGWLSWLVTPFARCQSKGILEQYESGCRYFDVRVINSGGKEVFAHGVWKSKVGVDEVLRELNERGETVYVAYTYEGSKKEDEREQWKDGVLEKMKGYENLVLMEVSVKKPEKTYLWKMEGRPRSREVFMILDWRSWHTLIPVPWLWDRIYNREKEFVEDEFRVVDFL